MIELQSSGSFKKSESFLNSLLKKDIRSVLSKYGQEGVAALSRATPKDTGRAASSWSYEVVKTTKGYELNFINDDRENGANVVILVQYGHGTTGGTYIPGRDFVNPAIKPIFEKLEREIWKAVKSA